MDGNGVDEARKKRDCAQVVKDDPVSAEEKVKKLRAKKAFRNQAESVAEQENYAAEGPQPALTNEASARVKETTRNNASSEGKFWDLESALHHVVRMGGGGGDDKTKEYVSKGQWISFRVGHTGDVSAIASLYRKSVTERKSFKKNHTTNVTDDTPLEVWLADGLGDEDTPPCVFALLANILSDQSKSSQLAAAALFTLAWEDSSRVLRVEWIYVDQEFEETAQVIERRIWLRLSALSILASCEMVVMHDGKESNHQADEHTAVLPAKF